MIPDKLFINLKILSRIQKNGRITRSTNGIIALENESFYQSIKRFITSDSRKQAIFEINSIVNETIQCLNNIVNSKFMSKMYSDTDEYYKNCENMDLILKELINAKIGIENLKFTYTADANISSQLDILIIKINSSIKDINHKLTYFQSFLPETYKTEIEEEKNISPNYYTLNSGQLQPEKLLTSKCEKFEVSPTQEKFDFENDFAQKNFNTSIIDMNDINMV
jgi:hypothetical protein